MSNKQHRLTPNPDFADKCREVMGRGEWSTLPHNWEVKMTKRECLSVFREKAKFAIKTAKAGGDLPRGWASGLTIAEQNRVYSARGFGSTDKIGTSVEGAKLLVEKRKKKEDWLKCHGGQHTQDVMAIAKKARESRRDHICRKRWAKITRRAISTHPEIRNDLSDRQLLDNWEIRRYDVICNNRRRRAEHLRPTTMGEMRKAIIAKAKYEYDLIRARDRLVKHDAFSFITDAVKQVGIFSARNFVLNAMPNIWCKLFPKFRDYFVGKDLDLCLLLADEIERDRMRCQFAKEINCGGTATNSARQLRALGFVA